MWQPRHASSAVEHLPAGRGEGGDEAPRGWGEIWDFEQKYADMPVEDRI
jgi:hypothetical protein